MYLAHLEKLNRTRLADVLVEEGVLDRGRVEEAQAEQDTSGRQLGEILIDSEVITDYELAKIIVIHYGLPYLDIASYAMRREVVELLPIEFRTKWAIQPLDQFGTILTIAVSEIPSPELIEEIVDSTNLTPILFVVPRRAILNVLDDEKKRGAGRTAAKAAAKQAAAAAAAPAPVAAHVAPAPKTGPVAVPAAPGAALPEFDLPKVSMKLAGGSSGGRGPVLSGRITGPKDLAAAGGKPAQTPGPAGKAHSAGALSWMDSVAGGAPAANDPAAPKVTKFSRPAPGNAAAGPAPASPAAAPGRPAAAAAKGATPPSAAKPVSPMGGGAWQTIFDTADESVKKPKQ